uniref:Uncharacterized protein n=1 Tax=Cacopsylla melanoneura TaxID=428564 RepID=A0A8D8SLN5_9HEMI
MTPCIRYLKWTPGLHNIILSNGCSPSKTRGHGNIQPSSQGKLVLWAHVTARGHQNPQLQTNWRVYSARKRPCSRRLCAVCQRRDSNLSLHHQQDHHNGNNVQFWPGH